MTVITNNIDLKSFCQSLKNKQFITIDTEFSRDKTYYPKLCLLQLSDGSNSAAFDPLVDIDFSPIYELLFDNNIVKVLHSGKQDLEIIYNITGKIPQKVFDTQIAASICGYGEQVAYNNLVYEILGVKLDKTEQYTDWSMRPLTQKKIDYAISDVTYLAKIYPILVQKLKELDRENWGKSEIDQLIDKKNYDLDVNKAWLRIKHSSFSKRHNYIIMKLAAWRELKAREVDVPRLHLMKDNELLNISNDILNNKPHKNIKYKSEILELAKEIGNTKDYIIDYPKFEPNLPQDPVLIAMLKALLKIKAIENNISEKLIAIMSDLEDFAAGKDSKITKGWQNEIFGRDAEKLKKGKLAISYVSGKVKLIEI